MEDNKGPKWSAGEAINSGKSSLRLLELYGTDLQPRLKTDEQPQHKANIEELEGHISGQKQTLTAQKSSTRSQETTIRELNDLIVSIRNIVRNANATREISVAYGIGDKIALTVGGVTVAGNIIVEAYNKFTTWSNDAGIIKTDITEVSTLIKAVGEIGKVQDDSMYVRKAKTMDKNTLQREVEDEVSRLSAIGARHFSKNPTVRKQFEDLIPSAHKPKPATTVNNKTEINGAVK